MPPENEKSIFRFFFILNNLSRTIYQNFDFFDFLGIKSKISQLGPTSTTGSWIPGSLEIVRRQTGFSRSADSSIGNDFNEGLNLLF